MLLFFLHTRSGRTSQAPLQLAGVLYYKVGFPGSSGSQVSARNAGDLGSIPGSGRSPGEGNGNPLQCSRQENSMDRAW